MKIHMRVLVFLIILLFLTACGNKEVKPDESMFSLLVHLPENINAGETVEIQVDIKNHSKYRWTGIHGLDLFKYIVKDREGNRVQSFEGIRAIDSLGIRLDVGKNGTYSFYKSKLYSKNLNHITIKNPGIYTLEVTGDVRIEHQGQDYPLIIKANPIEINIH